MVYQMGAYAENGVNYYSGNIRMQAFSDGYM